MAAPSTSSSAPVPTPVTSSYSSSYQPKPALTEEFKNRIIKEVTEDLISPNEVSKTHNIGVALVRSWIKKSGKELPKKYGVTSSATKTSSNANAATSGVNAANAVLDPVKGVLTTTGPNGVKQVVVTETGTGNAGQTGKPGDLQLPQKSVPIIVTRGGAAAASGNNKDNDPGKKAPIA